MSVLSTGEVVGQGDSKAARAARPQGDRTQGDRKAFNGEVMTDVVVAALSLVHDESR